MIKVEPDLLALYPAYTRAPAPIPRLDAPAQRLPDLRIHGDARRVPGGDADLVLNELQPCGVESRGPITLGRVESRHFDDTGASVAALFASCHDAASQVQERREGRQQAVCIARATRARARSTNAPTATWPNCVPKGACSGCSKSASSIAF